MESYVKVLEQSKHDTNVIYRKDTLTMAIPCGTSRY